MAQKKKLVPKFEPFTVEMEFDDPDDAEHVLLGLIVAQSNNSNEFFPGLIANINEGLEEWRKQKILAEVNAR